MTMISRDSGRLMGCGNAWRNRPGATSPAEPTRVAYMFNHQTHHRGQVHAMMTRAGTDAPVSDLFPMPEDAE